VTASAGSHDVITDEQIRDDRVDGPDLAALLRIAWNSRYLLMLCSGICGLLALYVALTATPIFKAEVVVSEVRDGAMGGGASSLVNQFGGLASLAGINLPNGGADRTAPAVLQSRRLVEEFIKSQNLVPVLLVKRKDPTLWKAVKEFREGVVVIREDKRTNLTTIAMSWKDPAVAARWANEFVALANELIRARAESDSSRDIAYLNKQVAQTNIVDLQRILYNLIESETKTLMLANARTEYAFKIVDPAVAPELKTSPKRALIVIFGTFLGFVIGLAVIFVRRAVAASKGKPA
jgi:uncharacterized protein involved in exopolysaccharide biosynthesis